MDNTLSLQRSIGLFGAVAYVVGSVIGSGIFISPKGVLQSSGSVGAALCVWFACGVISFMLSLTYIELGAAIPITGGDYIYIREGFGDMSAFVLYMWLGILVMIPIGQAILAMAFGHYIVEPFFEKGSDIPLASERLIAAAVLCLVAYINGVKAQWGEKLQIVTTIAKLLALLCIIVLGFVHLFQGKTANLENLFEPQPESVSQLLLASYSGMWAFSGWEVLNVVLEEVRNPSRTLPIAMLVSLSIVTVVYMLTIVAYSIVLSRQEMLDVNAVAVAFGAKTMGKLQWLIPVFVSISIFGILNSNMFGCSRIYFAGARQGHLPKLLQLVNIYNATPVPALIILVAVSFLALSGKDLYELINYTGFLRWIQIGMVVACCLRIRLCQPRSKWPIKMPIVIHIVNLAIILVCALVPIYLHPVNCTIGVAIMAAGFPVYWLLIYKNKIPRCATVFHDCVALFFQKFFLVAYPNDTVSHVLDDGTVYHQLQTVDEADDELERVAKTVHEQHNPAFDDDIEDRETIFDD